MNDDRLYPLPIRSSLNRPNHLMGAEREPILIIMFTSAALIGATLTLIGILAGVLIWIFGINLLRSLAKADPVLTQVYRRHIKYKSYYPFRGTAWRNQG